MESVAKVFKEENEHLTERKKKEGRARGEIEGPPSF